MSPRAKPAEVADYDSDESRIVSGTEVSAKASKRRPLDRTSSKAPRQGDQPSRTPVPAKSASDSGYSSTPAAAAGPKSATAAAPNTASQSATNTSHQKASTASPAKGKPIIHRADSARSTTRGATVSHTTAKLKDCRDSKCQHPECESKRNPERRYTNPNRMSMPPPATNYTYQQQYDYAKMPPPSAISRPRAESISRPRPQSIHAPAGVSIPYTSAQSVQPPPVSAYYGYPQGSYGTPHPGYGSTPTPQSAMYPPPSTAPAVQPTPSSPLTGTYPGYPGHTTAKYSARTGNPAVPGLANSITMPPPAPSYNVSMGTSARGERRALPPAVTNNRRSRADDYTSSESESSDDDSYEDERGYEQYRTRDTKRISYEPARSKSRRRESNVVVEDPRRPTTKKYHTTSELPTRRGSHRPSASRPDLAYRPRSDPNDQYPSSSEHYDSGTTSKAAVGDRRHTERRNAVDRHSRRPSVASSYDTPPTSLSSGTAYAQAIVEDKYGRRRVYLSKEEVDALTLQREREERREGHRDRLEDQILQQERIERYQKDMSAGIERQNLTAADVKQVNRRSTMSHVSGRSHKSTTSASKLSRGGGLMIESNGTVLYLEEGIQEIALKAEDGGTRVVIGSGTGRETSYNGSKSSGSRVGRPRTSRSRTLHDEGGYEKDY
ncbi:hypothetical protein CBER1_05638 [Cercospora berteroae]|uniref:Uncharacterized protein n=1 Tax=Cercospora berteroae TaxID=357750 RepID=A0A2S6C5I5_9PEZI|nr:hypothetical protein CBER1_05638 [Cercospora berteroae]